MPLSSLDILRRLIAFNTTSALSNLELITYVRGLFADRSIACEIVQSDDGRKANLFASVGPTGTPGILLSGHTDVVPVEGQNWSFPPFVATVRDDKVYGRGSCGMKGFVACAIALMLRAANERLTRPLHLALSYDEEIGCIGVRRLLDHLHTSALRPLLCIVGEPTQMHVALGHKGKTTLRAHCHGHEGHSSLAPHFPNAIHLAADLVGLLRATQSRLVERGAHDPSYDVPYTTVHVGKINGGTALNIVPNSCTVDFEIRNLPDDDARRIVETLREQVEAVAQSVSKPDKTARIELAQLNDYPGLDTSPTIEAVRFIGKLLPASDSHGKVAFGTEGGLFAQRLDVPVIVCGPGSIEQAHKPDEYISLAQLKACDVFLERLLTSIL